MGNILVIQLIKCSLHKLFTREQNLYENKHVRYWHIMAAVSK